MTSSIGRPRRSRWVRSDVHAAEEAKAPNAEPREASADGPFEAAPTLSRRALTSAGGTNRERRPTLSLLAHRRKVLIHPSSQDGAQGHLGPPTPPPPLALATAPAAQTMNSRAKDDFEQKVQSMRQYLPFLESIISQLENSKKKEHVGAARALYNLLTNPTKRIKMESLLKMETELKILYEKKHGNSSRSSTSEFEKTPAAAAGDCEVADACFGEAAFDFKSDDAKATSVVIASGKAATPSGKSPSRGGVSILKSRSSARPPTISCSAKSGKHTGLPTTTCSSRPNERLSKQHVASKSENVTNNKESANDHVEVTADKGRPVGPGDLDALRAGEQSQGKADRLSSSKYVLSRISPPTSPTLTYKARRESMEDESDASSLDPRLNRERTDELSADADVGAPQGNSNRHSETTEPPQHMVSLLKCSPTKSGVNKTMPPVADLLDDEGPGIYEEKQVFSCKHCSYVGKKIIPHYANRHPGKEMPVRLPEEELEDAINERSAAPSVVKTLKTDEAGCTTGRCSSEKSALDDMSWIPERSIFLKPVDCKMCGYTTVVRTNLIQHLMAHRHPEKNSHGLQFATSVQLHCRFCEYSVSNVQDFRDHVTAHTGEFLYSCGYCSFRGFSSKSVRSHITCNHNGQPPFVKRDPEIKQRGSWLVGFVCDKCRYVQLSESAVKAHVASAHSVAIVKVVEINMSRSQKQPPAKKCGKDAAEKADSGGRTAGDFSSLAAANESSTSKVPDGVTSKNRDEESLPLAAISSCDKDGGGCSPRKKRSPVVVDLENNDESSNDAKKTSPSNVESFKSKSNKRAMETNIDPEKQPSWSKKRKKCESRTNAASEEVPENEASIDHPLDGTSSSKYAEHLTDDSLSSANDAPVGLDYLSESSDSSPPFLMPEEEVDLNGDNADSLADDGVPHLGIVPSIAETISKLQAVLNKKRKPPAPSPPVLEPVDVKFARDKSSGCHRSDGDGHDRSSERRLYRCGAKLCGSFFVKGKEFLAHLEESHKPREAPCSECGGSFAQWKLLLNHVQDGCEGKEKATLFACGFTTCPYKTKGEDHFFSHMRRYHKRETQLPCYGCQKTFTLVTSLVNHIKTCCKNASLNAEKAPSVEEAVGKLAEAAETDDDRPEESPCEESEKAAGGGGEEAAVDGKQGAQQQQQQQQQPLLQVVYECPFGDCDHKSLEREVFKSHMLEIHDDGLTNCPRCKREVHNFDTLIAHMETEHKDDNAPRSNDFAGISEQQQRTQHSKKQPPQDGATTGETCSSSLKITSVTSLSKSAWNGEADRNVSSDERKKAQKHGNGGALGFSEENGGKRNPLDDSVPLKTARVRDPSEKGLGFKSKDVLRALLVDEKLKHLFRCMGFSCSFTTPDRSAFFLHLTDKRCGTPMICSYCLQECLTAAELTQHVVDSHGHCTFQCKYCFYRAAADDYVGLHQQRRHPESRPGVLMCDRHPDAHEPVNDPVSTEFVVPYRCAIGSCKFEVTDPLEFHLHNVTDHSSVSLFPCHHCSVTCISPERLLTHCKIHGCNKFQCGYCLHGAETEQDILFHLCSMHPNKRGRLFVRALGEQNKASNDKKAEFSHQEDSSSDKAQCSANDSDHSTKSSQSDSKLSNEKNAGRAKRSLDAGKVDEKMGHALFVCGYPPCAYSASTAECLREHMVTCPCVNEKNLAQCPHCPRQWRTITVFLEHVVTQHGGRRFTCGKCPFRGSIADAVQTHMKRQHGIPAEQTECVLKEGADPEVGEYVVQEVLPAAKPKAPEVRKAEKKVASARKGASYGIVDMDRLPMQSIFLKEVFCSLCGYSTKVRSNLIRHLQLHRRERGLQDASAGGGEDRPPVSEDGGKNADRNNTRVVKIEATVKTRGTDNSKPDSMKYEVNQIELNQTTSGRQQAEFSIDDDVTNCPQYIPDTSLYRCGVCCDYLALDGTMYRCHVTTLHPDNGSYPCPHCSERLSNLDRLVGHFRLHGPRLYKCGKCSYVNYRRHPVESHNNSAHGNRFLPVIIVREMTIDDNSKQDDFPAGAGKGPAASTSHANEVPSPKKSAAAKNIWKCALCDFQGPTKNNIKNHLQGSHGIRSEFRCGLCSCVSNAYESVRGHFVAKHPNTEVKINCLIVRANDADEVGEGSEKPEGKAALPCGIPSEDAVKSGVVKSKRENASERRKQLLSTPKKKEPEETSRTPNGLKIKIDLKKATKRTRRSRFRATRAPQPSSEEDNAGVNLVDVPSESICVTPDINFGESAGNLNSSRKLGFVCPICKEYRTRFRGDMRIHIYRELSYKRVQCMHCKMLFVSEKEAKHHAFKTHRGLQPSFNLKEIPEKENWVKEQLDAQVRSWGAVPRTSLKSGDEPSRGKESASDDEEKATGPDESLGDLIMEEVPEVNYLDLERHFRYCCPQCNYQCEGTTDLRKHIFRHLKFKPFQCNYCDDRFNEKQQMRNHHLQGHPGEEFVCQRDLEAEPERYVDELLQQQRTEWRDRKKNDGGSPLKQEKSLAQLRVAKMAEESEIIVKSENGEIQKAYTCKHDNCTFTCSQIKGLKVHLMAHMRKVKYRCGYCSLTGSSQYQLRRHCLHSHATKKMLVYALKADSQATSSQTTKSAGSKKKKDAAVVVAAAAKNVHRCPYCPYSHTLLKMISRHMMRHYVEKPFQCGYCKRTGIEKFDILHHCRKVHSDLEPKVVSVPMPANPEIRPILRRGYGYLKSDSDDNESTANAFETDQELDAAESESKRARSSGGSCVTERILKARRSYECNFCHVRWRTKSEVRKHLETEHGERGPRYRVIVTAPKGRAADNAVKTNVNVGDAAKKVEECRTILFGCDYCDLVVDSPQLLQRHSREVHTGSEVRMKKLASDWEPTGEWMLRCGHCGFASSKMYDLWVHHFKDHDGKPVKFRMSQRKTYSPESRDQPASSTGDAFVCPYCNDPCESLDKIKNHWKLFHGHLEFKYNRQSNSKSAACAEANHRSSESKCDGATNLFPDRQVKLVKVFGCCQCKYESDKYEMVRQHLFRHLQRYMCCVCLKTFPFEYEVKNHFEVHHKGSGRVEVVKNPNYDERERDELLKNIRTRIADKASLANSKHARRDLKNKPAAATVTNASFSIDDKPSMRRQVARKSFHAQNESPAPRVARTIARKSTSSRLRSPSVRRELLEQSLMQLKNASSGLGAEDLDESQSDFQAGLSFRAESPSLGDRVNISLADLYQIANVRPSIRLVGCRLRH